MEQNSLKTFYPTCFTQSKLTCAITANSQFICTTSCVAELNKMPTIRSGIKSCCSSHLVLYCFLAKKHDKYKFLLSTGTTQCHTEVGKTPFSQLANQIIYHTSISKPSKEQYHILECVLLYDNTNYYNYQEIRMTNQK